MTTYEACSQLASPGGASKLALLAVAVLVLLVAGWLALQVVPREHAVKKHGAEAETIRKCLNDNGPDQVWKFTSHRRNNHFIQCGKLDGDRDFWGIRIIQRMKDGRYEERTSFVVKDGTRQQMVEYVSAKAERFFGSLP